MPESHPSKIISTVPSITELLAYLDLDEQVKGITKFCIHPDNWFRTKTRIGGTKTLNLDQIQSLEPDLIIANKEENDKWQINQLQEELDVLLTDIKSFEDALAMILQIGHLTKREEKAAGLVNEIRKAQKDFTYPDSRTALYMIWEKPKMIAGTDTYIHHMMQLAGYENLCVSKRYPEISDEAIKDLNPEVVLLSSEPFPYRTKHVELYQKLLPNAKIMLIDGTYFSWYGSRLKDAFKYFENLHNIFN